MVGPPEVRWGNFKEVSAPKVPVHVLDWTGRVTNKVLEIVS